MVELPDEWNTYYSDGTVNSCSKAMAAASGDRHKGLISEFYNDFTLQKGVEEVKKGGWFFIIIPVPFFGIDIAYHLQEFGLTSRQILDSFSGIVSQILLPKLCKDCAKKRPADVEDIHLIYPDTKDPKPIWKEVGCVHCNQEGTRGRCAVQEVLFIDNEVRSIMGRYLEENTLEKFPSTKHIPMQISVRELVREGIVGIKTYKRVVFQNPLFRIHLLLDAQEKVAREAQQRAQIAERYAKAIEEELQTAHDMQMSLMPLEHLQIPGFQVAGRCLPANHVGGDFFKYYELPDGHLAGVLADVTGHAMEAAVPLLIFNGILESQMELGGDMETLFPRLNRSLCRSLPKRTYVCLSMVELEPTTRILRFSNGGCPYPYHYKATTEEVIELQVDAYPLGVRAETDYPVIETQLKSGDRVVFCSDGIIEAENSSGEIFGFEQTAETIRNGCSQDLSAPQLLDYLINEIKAFAGETPQGDDQTVVVLGVES